MPKGIIDQAEFVTDVYTLRGATRHVATVSRDDETGKIRITLPLSVTHILLDNDDAEILALALIRA